MQSNLKQYRRKLDTLRADWNHCSRLVKEESANLNQAEDRITYCEQAQQILQQLAQGVQEQAHEKIASVVSKCLEAVFDEPYQFQIHFERKRGKTEAKLLFVRNGNEVDPLTASGGGVVDVAAFALRLACIALSQPPVRRLVVMDEPFRFLSPGLRPRARQLLLSLAKEMQFQFVMVTHAKALQCGKVIEIT